MSKEQSVAKNLKVMTISVALTQIIALALKTMMPRVLGPEKMGVFYFAESTAMLFFTFLPLGLTTYINRTLPPKPEHIKDILWTVLLLEIAMAALIGLGLTGLLLLGNQSSETIIATLIMGVYAAFFIFQRDILQKIFIILGEVSFVSKLNVAVKLVLVIGSLLALYFAPHVALIAFMHLASEAFGLIWLLKKAARSGYVSIKRGLPHLKPMLKISLPFYLAGVLNGVYGQIDMFMLSQFADKKEVGYFGSAFKIIGIALFLVPVFQSSITPALSRALDQDPRLFARKISEFLRTLMIASLPLSVGLALFGDLIAALLNGPEFAPSFRIVVFLSPVLLMMYLNTFLGASLHLASSGKKLSLIFITGGIINVALDYIFIPYGLKTFGEGGGGLALSLVTFACELYVFAMMLYMLKEKVWSLRHTFNALTIFAPSFLGMYFYSEVSQLSLVSRILIFLFFIPYAWLSRLVQSEDWENLKELMPAKLKILLSRK